MALVKEVVRVVGAWVAEVEAAVAAAGTQEAVFQGATAVAQQDTAMVVQATDLVIVEELKGEVAMTVGAAALDWAAALAGVTAEEVNLLAQSC